MQSSLSISAFYRLHAGRGGCTGSTVELGLNYIADISATKNGGMYKKEDIQYNKDGGLNKKACEALTEGKSPSVGIKGWTKLPSNSYKAMMNALAKVRCFGAVSAQCPDPDFSGASLFAR